jgi:hypothetical protein
MIGTILNQIRQARALERRESTADALAEAQLQSYAVHAIEEERRPFPGVLIDTASTQTRAFEHRTATGLPLATSGEADTEPHTVVRRRAAYVNARGYSLRQKLGPACPL